MSPPSSFSGKSFSSTLVQWLALLQHRKKMYRARGGDYDTGVVALCLKDRQHVFNHLFEDSNWGGDNSPTQVISPVTLKRKSSCAVILFETYSTVT